MKILFALLLSVAAAACEIPAGWTVRAPDVCQAVAWSADGLRLANERYWWDRTMRCFLDRDCRPVEEIGSQLPALAPLQLTERDSPWDCFYLGEERWCVIGTYNPQTAEIEYLRTHAAFVLDHEFRHHLYYKLEGPVAGFWAGHGGDFDPMTQLAVRWLRWALNLDAGHPYFDFAALTLRARSINPQALTIGDRCVRIAKF